MISVIIPTFNGAHKIVNLLDALKQQVFTNFEVIIVIDGSKDDTDLVLQGIKPTAFPLKVIKQKNSGRSVTRNRGAKEAQGEILVFFDDDVRPVPTCLLDHWNHHQVMPESILVGNVPEDLDKVSTDFQRYKAFLSRRWVEPLKKNNGLLNRNNAFITAANFSIPKYLFLTLGGFDERLSDIEDYELTMKALSHNVNIFFSDTTISWHDDFVTCTSYISRQREYSIALNKFNQLFPQESKYKNYATPSANIFKALITDLLSKKAIVRSIDNHPAVYLLLPKKIRYSFYSLVIWGMSRLYPERKI